MRENPLDVYLKEPPHNMAEAAHVYSAAWREIKKLREEHSEVTSQWLDALNNPKLSNEEAAALARAINKVLDGSREGDDDVHTIRNLLKRAGRSTFEKDYT